MTTITIKLTQNKTALIDSDDSEFANMSWQYDQHTGYAKRKFTINGKRITKYLHRCIFEKHHGFELSKNGLIDHENNNRLDCTTNNLRYADYSQNNVNKHFKGNKVGYKGVQVSGDKFFGQISFRSYTEKSEKFDTVLEAFNWYCIKSQQYHGDFGKVM